MYERTDRRVGHNTPIDDALDAIQDEIRKRRSQRAAAGPPPPPHDRRTDEKAQAKDASGRKRPEGLRPR